LSRIITDIEESNEDLKTDLINMNYESISEENIQLNKNINSITEQLQLKPKKKIDLASLTVAILQKK